MAYIDNYGRPNNPVRDITGSTLGLQAFFAAKGSPSPTVHPLTTATIQLISQGTITTADLDILQNPLSETFDNAWNAQTDPSTGLTLHDSTVQLVEATIAEETPSNHSAYNISASVPTSGNLRALVLPSDSLQPNTAIFLSYEINGIQGNFTAHNTQNDWLLLFEDATFKITFNLEVLVQVQIPPSAGPPFTINASVSLNSAKISPTNYVGSIEEGVANIINFFKDQPPIFQAAVGAVDGTCKLNSLMKARTLLTKFYS